VKVITAVVVLHFETLADDDTDDREEYKHDIYLSAATVAALARSLCAREKGRSGGW
jgi:hypothetical protein